MWTFITLGLLIGALVLFFLVYQIQKNELASLRIRYDQLLNQERRVFEFQHGLGEAFSSDFQSRKLHQTVVEGTCRILEAQGGALYLADSHLARLIPAFITKDCPRFTEIPDEILAEAEANPAMIESYVRLHAIPFGEGLIGSTYSEGETRFLIGSEIPNAAGREMHSALLAPMKYNDETLGLLCVANGPTKHDFSASDRQVLDAIAEQSAFALYNARVHIEAGEKRRLDSDLQTAKEIQAILLPGTPPEIPGYRIAGQTMAARLVSGDYFDYIKVDETKLGVVIADVSGKGVPASLIMAMCRSVLRSHAYGNHSPADVLRKVNRQLYPDMKEDMFISLAYLIIDFTMNSIVMARAGHDPPLRFKAADGEIDMIDPKGMAIGIDSGNVFDRVTADFAVDLDADDCLLLYTDGVTEAKDNKGFEFGIGRTKQALLASVHDGVDCVVSTFYDELKEFIGEHPQYDDVTLIAIQRK